VVSSPPFATGPCGVLNESMCAEGNSGTNAANFTFFKSSISGLDPLTRNIAEVRWYGSDSSGTYVAFEGIGCNDALPGHICVVSGVAYGSDCNDIRQLAGGGVTCRIFISDALQAGAVTQSSLLLRRGTGPHRWIEYDAGSTMGPAALAYPVGGTGNQLDGNTCSIVTLGLFSPGSTMTSALEGICEATQPLITGYQYDSQAETAYALRLVSGYGQSAPEVMDAGAQRVSLASGTAVSWLGDADGDGTTHELLVGDAASG